MHYLRALPGANTTFRLVPVVVGVTLVSAALFKAHGVLIEPSNPLAVPFWLILIEVELFVGLALFFGIRLPMMRLVALVLFAAFAVAASFQAVAGARSCACLGKLEANPWLMAGLDTCLFAALWFWKPGYPTSPTPPFWHALFVGCCAFPALLPFLILSGREQIQSYSGLVSSPSQGDLGNVLQGDTREFELFLKNFQERDVTVYDVESSCPCLQAQGLPWHFFSGEGKAVRLRLDLHHEPNFSGGLLVEVKGKGAASTEVFRTQVKVRVVPGSSRPAQ